MGPEAADSQVNRTVNNYGVLGGNSVDLAQGPLVRTGNSLDAAIQGEGFFAVQTARGTRYTRDGSWSRSSDGTLTAAHGEAVLDDKGKPIRIPSVGEPTIGSDGAISVQGAVVAKVGIYHLSASELIPEGTNRYAATVQTPPPAQNFSIQQGAVESSNQDIVQGSLQLVLVQRQAEMMQKALSIFNNNLDKTASEELPRV